MRKPKKYVTVLGIIVDEVHQNVPHYQIECVFLDEQNKWYLQWDVNQEVVVIKWFPIPEEIKKELTRSQRTKQDGKSK